MVGACGVASIMKTGFVTLMSDPGCGRVDPEQEKRWKEHKELCLRKFRTMKEAELEAEKIARMPRLEDRREELALIEHRLGKTFADSVKGFLKVAWKNTAATRKNRRRY